MKKLIENVKIEKIDKDLFGVIMTLFHYFFYFKNIRKYDNYEVLLTCTFLAMKIKNRNIKLDYLIEVFKKINDNKKLQTETIVKLEINIMACMGFNFEVNTPFSPAITYLDIFQKNTLLSEKYINNLNEIKDLMFNIIENCYRRPLCLHFRPKVIALSSLYYVLVNFKDKEELAFTYKDLLLINPEVDLESVSSCLNQILNILEYNI